MQQIKRRGALSNVVAKISYRLVAWYFQFKA